jgi:hypothetical protein
MAVVAMYDWTTSREALSLSSTVVLCCFFPVTAGWICGQIYVNYLTKQLVLFNYRLNSVLPDVFKNSYLRTLKSVAVFNNSHLGVKQVFRDAQNPISQKKSGYSITPF